MNSETFRQNQKKKNQKKNLKFKELCFQDTLSDKFQQIVQKFATFYLSYPFFLVSFA